jgi:hypothetical protein
LPDYQTRLKCVKFPRIGKSLEDPLKPVVIGITREDS